MHTEELKSMMLEEAALLNDFAQKQEDLQKILSNRKWAESEGIIARLRALSYKIEKFEQKRYECFCSLRARAGPGKDESFSHVISNLPFSDRQELLNLYRKLKIAVIRVKGVSGRLGYYIRSLTESVSQVLEELFPYRKGKLYSRSGRARAVGDESIVVDRKL